MGQMYFISLVIPTLVFTILHAAPIPRTPDTFLLQETIFSGGSPVPANIENLRYAWHKDKGFERWVFDFSDPAMRQIGKNAPEFQIRYSKEMPHPKLILEFKSIRSNRLEITEIKKLLIKSPFVKNIVLYPPIEDGEVAIEFILKKPLKFSSHQPKTNEGRLVLDFRSLH